MFDVAVPSLKLIAALTLLVVCGPVLLFPELLPVPRRTSVVTLVSVTALGLGLAMLQPWKRLRLGLWLFLLAVVASWAAMPGHDLVGLRHFAGVGVGVLAMAVVATWCTTSERLMTATLIFALASTGILTLGLLSTPIDAIKFADPKEPTSRLLWAPRFRLDLPGMRTTGEVNANALGGTALMLLPMCAGLTTGAFLGGRRRRLPLVIGGVATMVAVAVLGITLSRMALIATLLTFVVWGLRCHRGRRWVLLALLLGTVGLAAGATYWRATAPKSFQDGIRSTRNTVIIRVTVWKDAMDRLRAAPWLGIGISQFHEVPRTSAIFGKMLLPNAHNVLIQVALDVGVLGLLGYVLLFSTLLLMADRIARTPGAAGHIVAGAGLSLVGVHLFGIADAVALGAKVGVFQWLCSGLILAAAHLPPSASGSGTD